MFYAACWLVDQLMMVSFSYTAILRLKHYAIEPLNDMQSYSFDVLYNKLVGRPTQEEEIQYEIIAW